MEEVNELETVEVSFHIRMTPNELDLMNASESIMLYHLKRLGCVRLLADGIPIGTFRCWDTKKVPYD